MSLLDHFPLPNPRKSQVAVLEEIEKAYGDGYKFVIVEAPVGSGKSPIALTVAKWQGQAHILTPRKSLQDQYYNDFKDDIVLMKGRSSYFCTFSDEGGGFHSKVINWVESGSCPTPTPEFTNCSDAPCKNRDDILKACTVARDRTCPYKRAIEIAEENDIIVHNFHSFLYQFHFALRFSHRPILIIDEAHEVEGILRGFGTSKFILPRIIQVADAPDYTKLKLSYWVGYFSENVNVPKGPARKEQYLSTLASFKEMAELNPGDFVVKTSVNALSKTTTFEFIPAYVGNAASMLLFSCADKVLLMSGTIYNKEVYCRSLGISPDDAYFIRTSSSFPVSSRPIYAKQEYLVDTSHSKWEENKEEMINKLKLILSKFPDVKGLIHVPSYKAAKEIKDAMKEARLHTHEPHNFAHELEKFFASKGNGVFVSPTCQQGVDFKGDRARFQVILRVPYLNTGEPFSEHKVKTDFPWYNHQALVIFGQQIGRINRSEDDFGVTILMDERFIKFLSRNNKVLPKWLKDSIIYK